MPDRGAASNVSRPSFSSFALGAALGFLLGVVFSIFVAAISHGPDDQDDPGPPAEVTVERTVTVTPETHTVTELPRTGKADPS